MTKLLLIKGDKDVEYKTIYSTTVQQMWIHDLNDLETCYTDYKKGRMVLSNIDRMVLSNIDDIKSTAGTKGKVKKCTDTDSVYNSISINIQLSVYA